MRLLLVEDDLRLANSLTAGLQQEGWNVACCHSGEDALILMASETFAVIVLDWMLPGISGLEVLERLGQRKRPPILMLTANIAIDERVRGLNAGANDYLVKPFALAELTARLRVLVRDVQSTPANHRKVGDLILDYAGRAVSCKDRRLELTQKEFQLLDLFLRHSGKVISRSIIADELWGLTFELGSNIIEVHVGNLRRKLAELGSGGMITTRRGIGYTFIASTADLSDQ